MSLPSCTWERSGKDMLLARYEDGYFVRYMGADRPIGAGITPDAAMNALVKHVMAAKGRHTTTTVAGR